MKIISNTFAKYNPDAAKLWIHENNNGFTPDNVSEMSGKTVYLRCANNPEHVFQRKVYTIPKQNPFGCPDCLDEIKKVALKKNNLFAVCPESKEMWDWEKNKGIDPYHLLPKSRKQIHLKCKKGHEFIRRTYTFTTTPKCPECRINKYAIASYPYLVNQWNFEKNKGIDIKTTSVSSRDTACWKCKKCGYEWHAQISSRKASKGLCPCCDNRTVIVNGITDLFTIAPDIKIDYDFHKNNEIDTALLSATTKDLLVWWKCHVCDHEWRTSPAARLKRQDSTYVIRRCPSCAGKVRISTYATEHPELIDRFNVDKNKCKLATLNNRDMERKFWWYCNICNIDFESELLSMIRSKHTRTKGCPHCSGKEIKLERSFAYLHPEVMCEYDSINLIDPYKEIEQSKRKPKWICRNNPDHKWMATFESRAKGESDCPKCKDRNYDYIFAEKDFTFAEKYPEFAYYFDTEKNEQAFSSYTNIPNRSAWWKCDKGHSFEWSILNYQQRGKFECPSCTHEMFVTGDYDFESQYPDLAAEFNVEKNGITPRVASNIASEEIWWKCAQGHEFQRSIWYRIYYSRKCPICEGKIVVKGFNDFQTAYPDVVKAWDYEANEMGPDTISNRTNRKYYFKCVKDHRYLIDLQTATNNDFECMVCSGEILQKGINSLIETDPGLAEEFSPNEDRRPYELTKNNEHLIKWQCPKCNGEYIYPINEREVGDISCPHCKELKALTGKNSIVDTDFELSKEWSSSNKRGPETYLKTNETMVYWQCPTCNGEYVYSINERKVGDDACPYCNGTKALLGYNSLADTDIQLSKEWSSLNESGPETYLKTDRSSVYWQCPTCSGEYIYSINKREVGDDSCFYCRKLCLLPGYNSLKETDFELSKEWSSTNESGPETYLKTDRSNAYWQCPTCSGVYPYSINKREIGDDSCPYCNGTKILPGYNSFKVNHPDLMKEWDYINNYLLCDANHILDSNKDKVWWNCTDCNRKYFMATKKRVYYKKRLIKSCPYCKGLRQRKRHFF